MIKHIKKILLCLLLLSGCIDNKLRNGPIIPDIQYAQIVHSSGEWIIADMLKSDLEKGQGLSGIKSHEYPENKGAFFFSGQDGVHNFWMPDTYFNLDIIYLDKNLKIIKIDKNVSAHPGYKEPPAIPRMKPVWCRHVLEIRAGSSFSKVIKTGDKLKWKSKNSF